MVDLVQRVKNWRSPKREDNTEHGVRNIPSYVQEKSKDVDTREYERLQAIASGNKGYLGP